MEILKKIANFAIYSIFGGVIASGVWYSLYERPSLSYNTNTYLFSAPQFDKENKITFLYKNNHFDKFYITFIDIINDGGIALEMLNYEDENNPLRIEGCQFFHYYIDKTQTHISSKVDLIEKDKSLFIKFIYMNPKDVISLKMLHTEKCNITITGSMKGLLSLTKQKTIKEYKKIYINFSIGLIILFLLVLGLIFYYLDKKTKNNIILYYIDNYIKSSKEKKKILNKLNQLTTYEEKKNYLKSLNKERL